MSRTLDALRRLEARGVPLTARSGAVSEQSYVACEPRALASLDAAEAAVALAIDEYATSAHRPIPALDMSETGLRDASDACLVATMDAVNEAEIEFVYQDEFAEESEFSSSAVDVPTAYAPLELVRREEQLDSYRALRSRLVTRQSAAGGSVLLLAATSEAASLGFSSASLAISLAELELGEVLLVGSVGTPRTKRTAGGHFEQPANWRQRLCGTSEPQVQVLPVDANFLTAAAQHDVCLWDCLRERFRFILLGPWLAGDPALRGLAEMHDGALLLLGTGESQRVARRSLGQLTAGGSRVLGCVAIV